GTDGRGPRAEPERSGCRCARRRMPEGGRGRRVSNVADPQFSERAGRAGRPPGRSDQRPPRAGPAEPRRSRCEGSAEGSVAGTCPPVGQPAESAVEELGWAVPREPGSSAPQEPGSSAPQEPGASALREPGSSALREPGSSALRVPLSTVSVFADL